MRAYARRGGLGRAGRHRGRRGHDLSRHPQPGRPGRSLPAPEEVHEAL